MVSNLGWAWLCVCLESAARSAEVWFIVGWGTLALLQVASTLPASQPGLAHLWKARFWNSEQSLHSHWKPRLEAGTPWLLPHAVDQSKSQASSHSRGGEKDSFLSKRSSKVTLPSSLDKRRGLICGHYCCLQQDYRDLTNITTPYILPPLPDCIFKQITLNPNRPFHNSRIWC